MEKLKSVRALYNTDKYTAFEIITNKDVRTIKLPYFKEEKKNREPLYDYTTGVIQYCRYNKIWVDDYLYGKSWEV